MFAVRLACLVALLVLPCMGHAMHKCKDASGRVTYSDVPCKSEQESLEVPDHVRREDRAARPLGIASHEAIDFGDSPEVRLIKSIAVLEDIQIDSRECDWALKVHKDVSKCMKFAAKMTEGGPWQQVTEVLVALTQDESFAKDRLPELNRARRLMEDINGVSQLLKLRLGS